MIVINFYMININKEKYL